MLQQITGWFNCSITWFSGKKLQQKSSLFSYLKEICSTSFELVIAEVMIVTGLWLKYFLRVCSWVCIQIDWMHKLIVVLQIVVHRVSHSTESMIWNGWVRFQNIHKYTNTPKLASPNKAVAMLDHYSWTEIQSEFNKTHSPSYFGCWGNTLSKKFWWVSGTCELIMCLSNWFALV